MSQNTTGTYTYKDKNDLPPVPAASAPSFASQLDETDPNRTPLSSTSSISRTQSKRSDSARSKGRDSHSRSSAREAAWIRALEDRKELQRIVYSLKEQLNVERARADEADSRLAKALSEIKALRDSHSQIQADANRATEEVRLYKIQLEKAQSEIYRAQDLFKLVDSRRQAAEHEASKYRSVARKYKDSQMREDAREEGRREGILEGLRTSKDFLTSTNRPIINLRSPDITTNRSSSLKSTEEEDEEEEADEESESEIDFRGIRNRTTPPGPYGRRISNSTSSFSGAPEVRNAEDAHHPPSHTFENTVMPPAQSLTPEPVMVPPPHPPSAPQTPRSTATSRKSRKRRSGRGSSPESNSTTLSQLDIVQDPLSHRMRHEWSSRMSEIPEVPTPHSSPHPHSFEGVSRKPSLTSAAGSSPHTHRRPPVPPTSSPLVPRQPERNGAPISGPYTRPRPSSVSTERTITTIVDDTQPDSRRSIATDGSVPGITIEVHPPTRSTSEQSLRADATSDGFSFADSNHPAVFPPVPGVPTGFGDGQTVILPSGQLPLGFVPMATSLSNSPAVPPPGSGPVHSPFIPPTSRGMPGSFSDPHLYAPAGGSSTKPVIPDPDLFANTPDDDDGDGVSSGMSDNDDADTLSTPPPIIRPQSVGSNSLRSTATGASKRKGKLSSFPMPPGDDEVDENALAGEGSKNKGGADNKKGRGKKGKKGK